MEYVLTMTNQSAYFARNTLFDVPSPPSYMDPVRVKTISLCEVAAAGGTTMIETDPSETLADAKSEDKLPEQRTPRTIRFSYSEWQIVEDAACQRDTSPSEYVRRAALDSLQSQSALDSVSRSPALVELVKVTYRAAYILSTLKRDEVIREGHPQEMDEVVCAAREAQAFVLSTAAPRPKRSANRGAKWGSARCTASTCGSLRLCLVSNRGLCLRRLGLELAADVLALVLTRLTNLALTHAR